MPIYNIACPHGHEHEVFAKWRDVTPCPTCGAETQRIWKGARNVIGDAWPNGKTFEHLGHEPVTVYSKTELKKKMDAAGLRHTDRYHPNDGPDWRMAIDRQTLENARILVSRQASIPTTDDPGQLKTFRGSFTDAERQKP